MRISSDPWICAGGPDSDVVLSCRARLARNLDGFPFVNRASDVQRQELVKISRQILLGLDLAPDMIWVDLRHATEQDRQLLVERHLISANLANAPIDRAVAISGDETLSIMVNEEDHLRMQVLAPGMQLREAFERVNRVDDSIESRVDFAFSRRWGFLTACPTNVGSGIRFSVMMHLPALKITGEINRVRRAAKDLHLAVRGYYGEGSESAGDFYQISNQVTLGPPEEDVLHELADSIIPKIIEYERHARAALCDKNEPLLEDRIHRALGVLQTSRLLGAEEAMKLLSRVRLGASLGRLDEITPTAINRLFLQIQPAHLQTGCPKTLDSDQLRVRRAEVVRLALN